MTKNRLKTLALILMSTLAVACGDAGANPGDGKIGTGGGGGEGGQGGDGGGGEGGQGGEPIVEAFCGDGFVDPEEQCDDGNEEDGDGCSSLCEDEVIEPVETEGEFSTLITIDDLNSTEAPLSDTCSGAIELLLDDGEITGQGSCALDNNNNFLGYEIDAVVDETGALEGEVEIVLNTRSHFVQIEGTLQDGFLSLDFDGVTLVTGAIRAIWDGTIEADFN